MMRKNLGAQPALFPMTVLMIAAYDEHGTVNVMDVLTKSLYFFEIALRRFVLAKP